MQRLRVCSVHISYSHCVLTLFSFFLYCFWPTRSEKKKKRLSQNGGTNIIAITGNNTKLDVKLSKLTTFAIFHEIDVNGR